MVKSVHKIKYQQLSEQKQDIWTQNFTHSKILLVLKLGFAGLIIARYGVC